MVTAQNNSSVRATTGGRRHESTAERRQRDLGTPATRPNRDNAGQRTDEEKRRAATVERRSGEANSRRPIQGAAQAVEAVGQSGPGALQRKSSTTNSRPTSTERKDLPGTKNGA
jgi:hypothetical protein